MRHLWILLFLASPCFASTQILYTGTNGTCNNSSIRKTTTAGGDDGGTACTANGVGVRQSIITSSGSLSNLYVRIVGAPGGSASWGYNVQKNDADTVLSSTISAAATTADDITHSVAYNVGDTTVMTTIPTTSPSAGTEQDWSLIFTSSVTEESILPMGGIVGTIVTNYPVGYGDSFNVAVATNAPTVFPLSGTLKNLYVKCQTAPGGATSVTLTVTDNGVPTAIVATLSGVNLTANSGASSATIKAGDLLSYSETISGSPVNATCGLGITFVSNRKGWFPILMNSANGTSNSANSFCDLESPMCTNHATEIVRDIMLQSTPTFQLGAMYAEVGTDPGNGTSYTFNLRKNGSTVNHTCTITGNGSTGKTCSDLIHVDTITQGDLMDWQIVPSGTPYLEGFRIGIAGIARPRRVMNSGVRD